MTTIVLPEGTDERMVVAAADLAKDKVVNPVLIGSESEIGTVAKK